MEEAFVIMQINNPQLDRLWSEVYQPVIRECGLEPKRVDKHNEGHLLSSEIANFIKRARILIADLTNERQNCYLEIGYAMGINKFRNLILCAREDHHHESKNYKKDGPKIHFDLSGYGFIWWDKEKLDEFKKELTQRIKHRLGILEKAEKSSKELSATPKMSTETRTLATTSSFSFEDIWLEEERRKTFSVINKLGLPLLGYYEISFQLFQKISDRAQTELLKIAEKAEVRITGWPIGVVLHDDNLKPNPELDGIRAIISSGSFDYWTLKKDGGFYFLRSYEEDVDEKRNKRGENIYFDTRICRIVEAVMYCSRLYKEFNIGTEKEIYFSILHTGLKGRSIAASKPSKLIMRNWKCSVDEVTDNTTEKLANLMPNIKNIVFKFTHKLFAMFDYFDLKRRVSDDIIDKFIAGKL